MDKTFEALKEKYGSYLTSTELNTVKAALEGRADMVWYLAKGYCAARMHIEMYANDQIDDRCAMCMNRENLRECRANDYECTGCSMARTCVCASCRVPDSNQFAWDEDSNGD